MPLENPPQCALDPLLGACQGPAVCSVKKTCTGFSHFPQRDALSLPGKPLPFEKSQLLVFVVFEGRDCEVLGSVWEKAESREPRAALGSRKRQTWFTRQVGHNVRVWSWEDKNCVYPSPCPDHSAQHNVWHRKALCQYVCDQHIQWIQIRFAGCCQGSCSHDEQEGLTLLSQVNDTHHPPYLTSAQRGQEHGCHFPLGYKCPTFPFLC